VAGTQSTTASACCSSTRSPGRAVEKLAAERDTAIVLTAPWHERDTRRTVIAGDTLVDLGKGPEINVRWLHQDGSEHEQVVEGLRPLLELPVEHVLATHGGPHERPALERALSSS
jgi:hypothetical protein